MPEVEEKNENKGDYGEVFFQWQVPEYALHERSRAWYLFMVAVAVFLIIYSIFTANFLFALIIILIVFIIFLREYNKPRDLKIQITEDGIAIGNRLIAYEEIQNFYIIYYPPAVKKLFLNMKGTILNDLSLPLLDNNPLLIREKLLVYLDEDLDKEHQTLADIFEQIFKL